MLQDVSYIINMEISIPNRTHAGIDDCGDQNADLLGRCCILFTARSLLNLEKGVKDLLFNANIEQFHGRNFSVSYKKVYNDFIDLVRSTLLEDAASFAIITFTSVKTKKQSDDRNRKYVTENFFLENNFDSKLSRQVLSLCEPVIWFAHDTHHISLSGNITVNFEIDRARLTQNLDISKKIIGSITIEHMVKRVYEDYRKKWYFSSPQINDIKISESKTSPIIQAADVLANFAVANLKYRFDPNNEGNRTKVKSDIFEKVFNNELNISQEYGLGIKYENCRFYFSGDLNDPAQRIILKREPKNTTRP